MNAPQSVPFRPTLTRGEGVHVWDAAGSRYLDATSGAFCMQLGYSRADLVSAMAEAAASLPHVRPSSFDSLEAQAYRAALLDEAGPPFTRVLLTSSGSDAVDLAIKAAWWYQRARGEGDRSEILSLSGHYHGATLSGLARTGWTARRAPFAPLVRDAAFGPPAYCARCFRGLTHPACGIACAEEALRETGGVAAFLAETIPAAGLAAAVPPAGWADRVRTLCDEKGLLWIADEVLTGFGRVGSLFAYQRLAERERSGATPDLVVFGKGASAGYFPLSGVLVSERVAAALEDGDAPFRHAQTFGESPVACAVGRRALAAYREEGVFAGVQGLEAEAQRALGPLLENPAVLEVRGMGALWGVELAQPGPGRPPYPRTRRLAEEVSEGCRARGVLVHASTGFTPEGLGDAILIAPPLITAPDLYRAIAAVLLVSIEAAAPAGGDGPWIEEWEDR